MYWETGFTGIDDLERQRIVYTTQSNTHIKRLDGETCQSTYAFTTTDPVVVLFMFFGFG